MTKPTKWHCAQWRQISLGIHPVWSVFAVHMKKAWVSYPLSAQWRLIRLGRCPGWSESWADVQADLSLRWAHMPFCRFCHALAHFISVSPNSILKSCNYGPHSCIVLLRKNSLGFTMPFFMDSGLPLIFCFKIPWLFHDFSLTFHHFPDIFNRSSLPPNVPRWPFYFINYWTTRPLFSLLFKHGLKFKE